MYQVVLVDDESVIRQGLKKIIDWNILGFEIIDEAENGLVAFDKITDLKPDLVLLDIKMPGYDGITLLKMLRENDVDCRVIFLTGFAEFEYAKKAIALGVEAFLTKPFDEVELIKVLKQVKCKLDEENHIARKLSSQRVLEEKKLYRRLLLGEQIIREEVIDNESEFCVVEVQSNENINIFNSFFYDYQEKHLGLVCLFIAGRWVIVFKNTGLTRIRVAMYDLSNNLNESLNNDFFISVGRQIKGHYKLHESFSDVKKLGQKWYLLKNQSIAYYQDQSKEEHKMFSIDSDLLFSYLEVNNQEGINDFFSKLEIKFRQLSINFVKVKGLCTSSMLIIFEKVKYHYSKDNLKLPESHEITTRLYKQENLEALMKVMSKCINDIKGLIHDGNKENTIISVLDYIDTHYNKNLKLERLGSIFGYNSSYLGTIFKQHTGMSFTNYLDSVRIEVAKKLLLENKTKVYEVSELVGYSSVDYFHSKFKKYVKMSPKKYQMINKES